ncbi:MAG: DUF6502 family protein [Burkholderiaceae bacterium]
MPSAEADPVAAEQAALAAAVRAVLGPLARLMLARGLPYAAVQEQLKLLLVQAADDSHHDLLPHRRVSRISTATGINRREVTRLIHQLREGAADEAPARRTLAAEVFTHWLTAAAYRDREGQPRALPRSGRAPSFEALAREITRDVHPRSILDELLRLGLARLDARSDEVSLVREAFVPRGDAARMMQFLADNVGDHAAAAVANVLGDGQQHFEQAVFADGLSAESVKAVRGEVTALWQQLLKALVPMLEAHVQRDAERPDARQRMRLGFYTFDTSVEPADAPAATGRH